MPDMKIGDVIDQRIGEEPAGVATTPEVFDAINRLHDALRTAYGAGFSYVIHVGENVVSRQSAKYGVVKPTVKR